MSNRFEQDIIVYLTIKKNILEKAKELSALKDVGLITYLEEVLQQSINRYYDMEQESYAVAVETKTRQLPEKTTRTSL